MSEQPFEQLAYKNRFVKELRQPIEGTDCFVPYANLNPTDNLIILNLTAEEYLKMYSALLTGADITYPDESMQIVVNFLKGIHCPPILEADECLNLPTYANNIAYSPVNPFLQPDVIPPGYLTQPFLVNGQNGNDFPGFEDFDVFVPFGAITFDIDWFSTIDESLPSIQVVVQGEGSVNVKFLCTPQGGLAVVTLDSPPNIIDIIAGIVTGAENIVDLNQDLVSLPPETAKEIIFPVTVEGAGVHTIYITYLPILDDSLIPVRFGGGFRGLELCGFLPEGDMGIQNLRFQDCNLEQQNSDGSWSVVEGWEDWLDCIPGGGGGSALASIKAFSSQINAVGSPTWTSVEPTYQAISNTSFNYTPQHTKMLVIFDNCNISNSGTGRTDINIRWNGSFGTYGTRGRNTGGTQREVQVSDVFEGLTPGVAGTLQLYGRVQSGTGTLQDRPDINIVILEYDDASALYVEDIRFVAATRQLQKKIGGAWITVTDSLATTLNAIEAVANNAAAAAAAAQSTANAAQTTANGAVTVNNTQNTRLNNLEADVDDLQLSVAQINLDIASLDSRVDALEVSAFGGVWAWIHDFLVGSGGYTAAAGTYSAGVGWISSGGNINLTYGAVQIVENQITHVEIEVQITSGVSSLEWSLDNGATWMLIPGSAAGLYHGWGRVPNSRAGDYFNIRVRYGAGTGITLKYIRYLGRGNNIPFD